MFQLKFVFGADYEHLFITVYIRHLYPVHESPSSVCLAV